MPAFLLLDLDLDDAKKVARYKLDIPPFAAKYGGRLLDQGHVRAFSKGEFSPVRLEFYRFPNFDAVRNMLNDPDYQRLKTVRTAAARAHIVACDNDNDPIGA